MIQQSHIEAANDCNFYHVCSTAGIGGVSTNGLSDMLLIFFEMILLSCLK